MTTVDETRGRGRDRKGEKKSIPQAAHYNIFLVGMIDKTVDESHQAVMLHSKLFLNGIVSSRFFNHT